MKKRIPSVIALLTIVILLLGNVNIQPTFSQSQDWDMPDGGHFFTQTGGGGNFGYAITDSDGIGFWSEFRRLGGVAVVGYPVSQRFLMDGFICQAMQRVIFQWQPKTNTVSFLNVFDLAHQAGKDNWLTTARQTPAPVGADFDAGLNWNQVVQKRLALIDAFPAIKQRYNAVVGDPIQMNGLPTSVVTDMGNNYTLRCQRVVIQQWKQDVPWAHRGDVTVANGGDIAKELQMYPPEANQPSAAPGQTTMPTATTGCALGADAIKLEKTSPFPDGSMNIQGTVTNTCSTPQTFLIDEMAYSPDGKPLMDGKTITVANVPAGTNKSFTGVIPGAREASRVELSFSAFGSDFTELDVGTTKSLKTNPALLSSISKLRQNQWGNWLLRVAAENNVILKYGVLDPRILGVYRMTDNTITLNELLDDYSSWVRATVLAHELQHAADKAAGKPINTTAGCYQTEEDAFQRESDVWISFWSSRLPANIDGAHASLNEIAVAVAANPNDFKNWLTNQYSEECDE